MSITVNLSPLPPSASVLTEAFGQLLVVNRDAVQTVPGSSGATGIAIAASGHQEGATKVIVIPAGNATSFSIPPEANFSGDAFDPTTDWRLFVTYVGGRHLSRGVSLATKDTTKPTVVSALVDDDAPSVLVVNFSEAVYVPDLTGTSLSFSVGTPRTITAVQSGQLTNQVKFTLSGSLAGTETCSLVFASSTLQDVNGNTIADATVPVSVFPIEPDWLADMMFWWRADATVNDGSTISQWTDKGNHGNHGTQSTPGNRADYLATGGPNSKPAAGFDGSNDYYQNTAPLISGANPADFTAYTLVVVFKFGQNTADGVLLGTGDPGNVGAMPRLYQIETAGAPEGLWWMVGNSPDAGKAAVGDQNWHWAKCVHTTASRKIYIDGVLIQTTNASNDPAAIRKIVMGASADTLAAKYNGRIADMMLTNRELTGQEDGDLSQYISGRYGLPV